MATPQISVAGLFQKKFLPEPEERDQIVLLQAFLDELLLGPGKVDGRMGEFTRKAALIYQARLRRPDPEN